MGRILMNATVGDVLDLDSLDAEPMEVVEKRSFIGRYGIIQTGEMKYNLSGTEAADIVAPGDDYLHLRIPMGAYTDRYDNNDQYNTEVIAKYADIRPKVGYINQNHVLEGVTILGAPGKMKNFAGLSTWICGYEHSSVQVHPQDPNQALVKGLVNANSGFIEKGSTEIEFNIANAVPKNIRYGVKIGRTEYGDWGADDTNTITGEFTGDATAMASQILLGRTAYVKGNKVTGTLAVNSAFSFSIAAISGTEIEIYWTNPSKGPYSGVFIEMSTSGYPTAGNSTRVYTGLGTNSNPGGRSSCKITGLQPQTTYYFTANSYCNGLPNGNAVNLTATTEKVNGQQVYTTSGTFTVPAGVTSINAFLVGGGGSGTWDNGGGRYNHERKGTYGGGGGGYVIRGDSIAVTPGENLTIIVGSGGKPTAWGEADGEGHVGGSSHIKRGTVDIVDYAKGGDYASRLESSKRRGGNGGSGGGSFGGTYFSDSGSVGYAGAGGSNGSDGYGGQFTCDTESEYWSDIWKGGAGNGQSTIDMFGTLYAGGGGGALFRGKTHGGTFPNEVIPAAGGAGGGGAGAVGRADGITLPVDGSPGTGGGGGGGVSGAGAGGGFPADGGSGCVIIKWG